MARKNTKASDTGLNSHFKLSKSTKRVMSLQYTDRHARGAYKRSMIAAEYALLANKKRQPGRADVGNDE